MLLIVSVSGRRKVEASEFPFAIGISRSRTVLFGDEAEHAPVIWVRSHQDRIYIQPESGTHRITHNDVLIEGSIWLAAGDRIEIGGVPILVGDAEGFLTFSSEEIVKNVEPPPTDPVESDIATERGTEGASVQTGRDPEQNAFPSAIPPRRPSQRGWARKLIFSLFAILLLGAVFVISASPVRIAIAPEPDMVSFAGKIPPIPVGERYLVMPGEYSVVADLQGYRTLDERVTIPFGSRPDLTFQMKKLPGRLSVTTKPVTAARVMIDDRIAGATPLNGYQIEPGRHVIKVITDRYLPAMETVEIRGKGEEQAIEVQLRPGWGTLIVSSNPDQTTVKLDGDEIGKTPLTFEPMQGNYELALSREGWKPVVAPITISAGQMLKLPPFNLERVDGFLSVKTKPSGATVAVDGQFRGSSPLTLSLVSKKTYRVKLTKPGHVPYVRSVGIEGNVTTDIDVNLTPELGVVFILSKPSGATLRVDGKELGSASRRLRLTTVPHRVEVYKKGYATFSTTVTPRKGVSKRLNVTLKTNAQVAREKARHPIKTRAGHVMRLLPIEKPVRLMMGASRREAGRRANETQYTVELTRSFMIGAKEVTNAQFRRFRPRHDSGAGKNSGLNAALYPVASVSWDDTARYLNWLSKKEGLPPAYLEENGKMVVVSPMTAGYRLPTEAEWAYAARYDGGRRPSGQPLKYPWGKAMPPRKNSGNFADMSASRRLPSVIRGYTDGYVFAAPVGSFTPNDSGIYDLGGNVAEWCHDFYDTYVGASKQVKRDPMGPGRGEYRVVRGSSWRHGTITELRLSYRDYAKSPRDDLGFRIARYVDIAK